MILNKKHGLTKTRHIIVTGMLFIVMQFAVPSYAADSAQINLKDADIKTLIDMVSRITKKTFIVDPRINGKVSLVTGRDIDEDELYEVFLSVLQVHNFSAVKVGNLIKIVPSNKAKQLPVPVIETEEELQTKKPDDLITRVVRVEHVPASMLVPILRPLVPSTGQLQAYAPSNTIVISDTAANIERLVKVIRNMDRADDEQMEVVQLKYASAKELAATIQKLNNTNAKIRVPGKAKIAADERTNSLLLGGDKSIRGEMRKIIARLDTPSRALEVIELKYAVASELAKTILDIQKTKASAKGIVTRKPILSVDQGTNSLLLGGDTAMRQEIKRIIRQFDKPRKALEVIPLRYAVAKDLAQTIKDIQSSTSTAKGVVTRKPIISVDNRTNSLLLGGDVATRQQIKRIIRGLDIAKPAEEKTRVVYLRYAQAVDLAKVLTGYSKTQKTTKAGEKGAAGTTNAEIDIQADESTNSLIITADKIVHANLAKVIRRLDIRRAQVMVEVIIAEVSENLSKEIGVQLAVGSSKGTAPIAMTGYSGSKVSLGNIIAQGASALPGGVGIVAGIANTEGKFQFAALMNALQGDAATNILSTPNVVAMDNEEAKFVIGKNVPFVTGSFTSTGSGSSNPSNPFQTIERKDIGLTLKIKPQVNEGDSIILDIDQEISSLAASNESASDLITNKRAIQTKVMVEDNQILVLGGLMQDDYTTTTQKIPVLGDLPIIGKIFQNNRTTKVKQNLMIFIHPVILRDVATATGYTREKYNKIRRAQKKSRVTSRGLLKEKATPLPRRLESITTQKMTPAQIKAMRLAEWKKKHPEQYGNTAARRNGTGSQGAMTPAQIRAKRLAEWNKTHPTKATKVVKQPVNRQQTGLEAIDSF
jgi:general secretion pathway protein D